MNIQSAVKRIRFGFIVWRTFSLVVKPDPAGDVEHSESNDLQTLWGGWEWNVWKVVVNKRGELPASGVVG